MSLEQRQVISFRPAKSSLPPFSEIERKVESEDRVEIAKMHIYQSGFVTLAQDCVNLLRGELIENELADLTNDQAQDILSKESFYMTVIWNVSNIDSGVYLGNALIIEGLTNGTIIVHGNLAGSTVLRKEEWFANDSLQVLALEKAEKHPMQMRYLMDVAPGIA